MKILLVAAVCFIAVAAASLVWQGSTGLLVVVAVGQVAVLLLLGLLGRRQAAHDRRRVRDMERTWKLLAQIRTEQSEASRDIRRAVESVSKSVVTLDKRQREKALERHRVVITAVREHKPRFDRITEVVKSVATVTAENRRRLSKLVQEQSGVEAALRRAGRNQYSQVESLINLYRDLDPPFAFPPLAGWAASPDLLRYLYELVCTEKRESVVECGSGVTTLVMAYAMRKQGEGRVVALEHLAEYAAETTTLLERHGLGDWATVLHAPLVEVKIEDEIWPWYDPAKIPEGPFDLVVVDGPPAAVGEQSRYPAVPLLRDRLASDAVIVLDDYRREQEREVGRMWQESDPEWTASRLVHEKGTLELRTKAPE
ncbi:O-methyltransferase [Stackebrandtia albiflava]|uniref:O-methyltransferase n=1 Tax=Stackebrandtia albiflava TaxID=406432 RepID=UPI00131530E2|nr:class I SAM-dependent methyltransferase [Stackebrandtia albiflava]